MPLEGTLKDISLPNLVQWQCSDQKRAQVTVTRKSIQGVLVFADGELVHAMVGPIAGEDAVYELLTWDEGSFQVSEGMSDLPARNVGTPWQSLVLEGLRRADEIKSDRVQTVTRMKEEIQQVAGITEWHLCTIDGQEITVSGESVSSPIGDWTAKILQEGARLARVLGMGDLAEVVLSNSKQKRLLMPRERYWITVVTSSNVAVNAVRDVLAGIRRR